MTAKIVAVSNRKGGTGKTTTAVNFAAALALRGNSVLLIDWDPQGNATTSVGVRQKGLKIFDIVQSSVRGLDLMSGRESLELFEEDAIKGNADVNTLGERLFHVKHEYVVIDCAPSLSWLTINALVAASCVLIPVQCEFLSLDGLSKLSLVLELLKLKSYQRDVRVLFTMYDKRNRLARAVEDDVRKHFADQVLRTKIPRNVRLAEAPSHGTPGVLYDPSSAGAIAYKALAEEFLGEV